VTAIRLARRRLATLKPWARHHHLFSFHTGMSHTVRRVVMGLLLLVALGFARLGVWQLSRLHERRAQNLIAEAARRAPPVTVLPGMSGVDTLAEHRVVARGRYDRAREIVIRGDVFQGTPGVRLVTPLLLAERGPAVLVDRGFLPTPDAVTVDVSGVDEPGEQQVRGIALRAPTGPGEPIVHEGRVTWRRLDLDALREQLPYPVLPIIIRQTPDSALPSYPRRLEAPPVDEGPHLMYAVQWFLFAGMAAAFAVLIVGRPIRR
jgi:surfeit locus 1 family protein